MVLIVTYAINQQESFLTWNYKQDSMFGVRNEGKHCGIASKYVKKGRKTLENSTINEDTALFSQVTSLLLYESNCVCNFTLQTPLLCSCDVAFITVFQFLVPTVLVLHTWFLYSCISHWKTPLALHLYPFLYLYPFFSMAIFASTCIYYCVAFLVACIPFFSQRTWTWQALLLSITVLLC